MGRAMEEIVSGGQGREVGALLDHDIVAINEIWLEDRTGT